MIPLFRLHRPTVRRRRAAVAAVLLLLAAPGCTPVTVDDDSGSWTRREALMDRIAADYVKLVLAVGTYDEAYVDAYYGPEAWKAEVAEAPPELLTIRARAGALRNELEEAAVAPDADPDDLPELRRQYLDRQLHSLMSRVDMLSGVRLSFDEESKLLYDAVAPIHDEEHFREILGQLGVVLGGDEDTPLLERYDAFNKRFVVPPDRLDTVFTAAIDACRKRTRTHIDLPAEESFEVEYVTDKPWSAYNWYQGRYHSLIQVNTDFPVTIDRVIDLACHEGYPGHHVYNVLLEKHLVRDRGWVEYQVYPLFSPQSLIAEGTANFGIEVAFPGTERAAFERDVLFPLAGLDPSDVEQYERVESLVKKLNYAGNEAARGYLDGTIDAEAAADWLERYALMSPDRARQRVRFIETYRSYVINYNLGQDLVRSYIERRGGTANDPRARWDVFRRLISSPRLPSGLK